MLLDRLGLWPARAIWLAAPLTTGAALSQTLESEASTPALIVEIALWLAWFVVLVAGLTPSPRSLTVVRVMAPAAFGACVLVGFSGHWTGTTLLGLGWAALFTAVAFLPTVGDVMVNGSAYGSERRMTLRPPAFVLLGPAQLAWLVIFGGLVCWAVLLLAERYVLAAIALVVGAGAVWAGARILHQLARRWVVFVPAGFVIHDPLLLVDAILLRRNEVTRLGPALEGPPPVGATRTGAPTDRSGGTEPEGGPDHRAADATDRNGFGNGDSRNGSAHNDGGDHAGDGPFQDLSGGALGLALEVALRSPTPVTVRERGQARNTELGTIVFTPTLPGAMLREARIRGLKIASADGD
ncbi:MAG: hypothetical protein AAGA65_12395 [Actinomycetota bacterium]